MLRMDQPTVMAMKSQKMTKTMTSQRSLNQRMKPWI
jgi:hypothetical protein